MKAQRHGRFLWWLGLVSLLAMSCSSSVIVSEASVAVAAVEETAPDTSSAGAQPAGFDPSTTANEPDSNTDGAGTGTATPSLTEESTAAPATEEPQTAEDDGGAAAPESADPAVALDFDINADLDYFLFFQNWDDTPGATGELYRMHVATGAVDQLTDMAAAGHKATPHLEISPDGSQIAFAVQEESGDRAIYVADTDGSKTRRVGVTTGATVQFAWSSDGSSIIVAGDNRNFEGSAADPRWFLGALPLDQDASASLILDSQQGTFDLIGVRSGVIYGSVRVGSPDPDRLIGLDEQTGREIVSAETEHGAWQLDRTDSVAAQAVGVPFGGVAPVNLMRLEASGLEALPIEPDVFELGVVDARLSPNGQFIAYGRRGPAELVVVDSEGSNLMVLVDEALAGIRHQWAPNSESLIFTAGDSGWSQIHVVALDGTSMPTGWTGLVLAVLNA